MIVASPGSCIRQPLERRVLLVVVVCLAFVMSSVAGTPITIDLLTERDVLRIEPYARGMYPRRIATCDLNGDRLEDMIIGAEESSGAGRRRPGAGEIFVLFGRRGSWRGPLELAQADVRILGRHVGEFVGVEVGCGDVNGDGYADIAASASNGGGPDGSRLNGGAVHIIFGDTTLPAEIDLADGTGVMIHGANPRQTIGRFLDLADINGDRMLDLLISADNELDRTGTIENAGRVYVEFGRLEWPEEIDLAVDPDLVVYGSGDEQAYPWGLGSSVTPGDLDLDGISELIIGAPGASPSLFRRAAGQIQILRGRGTWPRVIDLANEPADSVVSGAREYQSFGHYQCYVADLDGNGTPDFIGAGLGGTDPQRRWHGLDLRMVELGPQLPRSVDLNMHSDLVLFPARPLRSIQLALNGPGDVNGDGTTDLMFGLYPTDGPDGTRIDASELSVFFGRAIWPKEMHLDTDPADIRVYGAYPYDEFSLGGSGDINGDGLDELIGVTDVIYNDRLQTLYVLSPFDIDGDGISQLPDNCARLYNPDQRDSDGDLVGDLCDNCPLTWNQDQRDLDGDGFGDACDACPGLAGADAGDVDADGVDGCHDNCPTLANADQVDRDGDGVGDACDACPAVWAGDFDGDGRCAAQDNCPLVFNAGQLDSDHDGVGDVCDSCPDNSSSVDSDRDGQPDACDCRPLDAATRQPDDVRNLILRRPPSGVTQLLWDAPTGADSYGVRRGDLGAGQPGSGGSCVVGELVEPSWDDSESPLPGAGFFYLVQAQSATCGAGLLGADSQERPRAAAQFGCDALVYRDSYATDEVSLWGSVQGDANDTRYRDGRSEVVTEQLTPGGPNFFDPNRFSVLEHQWSFEIVPGEAIEFHLTASRTASPDGDDFRFEYSTDSGASWIALNLGRLPLGTGPRLPRAIPLPSNLAGAFLLRVVDTDRMPASQSLDILTIDEMFVRTVRPTLAP